MPETAVRGSIKVSKETDRDLRACLGTVRAKNGRSKFIEDAVRWRLFDETVQDIKARNADTDPVALQAMRSIVHGSPKALSLVGVLLSEIAPVFAQQNDFAQQFWGKAEAK